MSRKPDYDLAALHKRRDDRCHVGAAWINKDGSISIALNPFVVLSNEGRELVLTLFPRKAEEEK